MRVTLASLMSLTLLTACGGGGGNSDTPETPEPEKTLSEQTVQRASAAVKLISQSFHILNEQGHLPDLLAFVNNALSNPEENNLESTPNLDDSTIAFSGLLESCGNTAEYTANMSLDLSDGVSATLTDAQLALDEFCLSANQFENIYTGQVTWERVEDTDSLLARNGFASDRLHITADYQVSTSNPSYLAEEKINIDLRCAETNCQGDVTVDENGEQTTLNNVQFFTKVDTQGNTINDGTTMITGFLTGSDVRKDITADSLVQCDNQFFTSGKIEYGKNRFSVASTADFTITFDGCDYFTIEEGDTSQRIPYTDLSLI